MGRNLSARLQELPPAGGLPTPPRPTGRGGTPSQEDPFWKYLFLTIAVLIVLVTGVRVYQMLQSPEKIYGVPQIRKADTGALEITPSAEKFLSGPPFCVTVSSAGAVFFVVRSADGWKVWETYSKLGYALKYDGEKSVFYYHRNPAKAFSPSTGAPMNEGLKDELVKKIYTVVSDNITVTR